jgi:hypothetical protein
MTAYTTFWRRDTWRRYEREGGHGEPLDLAAGSRLRARLEPGDTLFVTGYDEGELLLIGRIRVDEVVDRPEAERRLGHPVYPAPDIALAVSPRDRARYDRIVPEDIARGLRFADGRGLRFASPARYRIDGQTLRGLRELSPESAATLDGLIDTGTALPEGA